MLTGDNGILKRAGEAKEVTEKAQKEEAGLLAAMEAATNVTETTFQGVKIPAGYAPTKKEGESTVDKGLVITDSQGNEFVWVVVPRDGTTVYPNAGLSIEKFTDEECTVIAKDLATYSGSTLPSINSGETFAKHLPPTGEGVPDYTSAYKDVLKSIYQNGGFWVGRYETGIQGTENATTSARNYGTDYTVEHPIDQVAVIKENVQPYTYVTWEQAQTLAQGISAEKKGDKTSSLLMGVQWDLVLKFIGKDRSVDTNSSDWGNYRDSVFNLKEGSHYAKRSSGTLSTTWKAYNEDEAGFVESSEKKSQSTNGNGILYTTGANTTNNSKKNICDIAGNVFEWTIENTSYSSWPCSSRGGNFNNTGARASYRSYNYTANSSSYGRFPCSTLLVDLSTV